MQSPATDRRRTGPGVHFTSSHVDGSADGLLSVGIERDGGSRRRDPVVEFEVPPDFHAHNDSVAAALMTLVGDEPGSATFNFPISSFCAETLANYYHLETVGPVDPNLPSRPRGRFLGMNFSGGLDSSALRALLDRMMPGEFRVISTNFMGKETNEEAAQRAWPPDLSCRTDFRRKGYFSGRFTAAVPLLFADYLDLYGLTSAHVFSQDVNSLERNVDGHLPAFFSKEPVYRAGGLEEIHLLRGLDEVAILRVLMRLAPERLEWAVRGSSQPGTLRNISRRLSLRILFERENVPAPEIVRATGLETRPEQPGQFFSGGGAILFVVKHYGEAGVRVLSAGDVDMSLLDFSFLDDLTMDCALKYNTNYIEYIPPELRRPVLTLLASIDIQPYNERDWRELDAIRAALLPALVGLGVIPGLP